MYFTWALLALLMVSNDCIAKSDEQIDKEALKVRVFRKSDPPPSCEEIGSISTPNIEVLTDSVREQMLRRMAAQKGANGMQVTNLKGETLSAAIFKCKK